MTTYNPIGYNFITIPRFDVRLKFSNNSSIMLKDSYMRFFALICLYGGMKLSYFFFKLCYSKMRNYYYLLKGINITDNSYCLVIGFGDSDASLQIAEYFASKGFNLILINNDFMIKSRENQIKELEKYKDIKINVINSETIANISFDKLKAKLDSKKINLKFIFDASILRIKRNPNEITTADLTFSLNKINEALNVYNLILEFFKEFSSWTNVYILEFADKQFDADHRLFSKFKSSLINTFAYIMNKKFVVKTIDLYSEKKKKEFSLEEINTIYQNSNNNSLIEFNFL